MSKIINCSIDLTLIDKERVKKHSNGASYYNFSVMERKDADEYGNTHYIVEGQTKEERAAKAPKNYLRSSGKQYIFGEATADSPKASNDFSQADEDDLPF